MVTQNERVRQMQAGIYLARFLRMLVQASAEDRAAVRAALAQLETDNG